MSTLTQQLRRVVKQLRVTFVVVGVLFSLGFAGAGGIMLWQGNDAHNQVTAQLAPQYIMFPDAGSKGLEALKSDEATRYVPDAYDAVSQYAGQQVLTGDQAKVFADDYIYVHMQEATGGKAYAQLDRDDPVRATAFNGNTLRAMLLQAYAFWNVGSRAIMAAYAFFVLAGLMLIATFVVDRWAAPRLELDFAANSALATT